MSWGDVSLQGKSGLSDLVCGPRVPPSCLCPSRLYPVVPSNARFISENDVILRDFCFPKNVGTEQKDLGRVDPAVAGFSRHLLSFQTLYHLCHYAICHDESQFAQAEKFLPERWLRGNAVPSRFYQHHPYSFIPFGVGVRACVGKRVAEMEMFFALSRVRRRRLDICCFQPGCRV